jgi:tight adherence protein C
VSAIVFILGVLLLAGACVALLVALGVIGQTSPAVRARLRGAKPAEQAVDVARPVIRVHQQGAGFARFLTTSGSLAKIERNLQLAGRPPGWTAQKVATGRVVLAIVAALLFAAMVSSNPSKASFLVGGIMVLVAVLAPGAVLTNRATARQLVIQQELPDILDQVTISIESGMGFEAAFSRIGERRSGPLADEIVRTVQDMRLGMSRREAYQALAERTDVEDLRRFVKSIVQADQYGISIASVVRTQAAEIRFKRKARAEGKALQVPVKILFPLLVCILPVLFIVVLTPAIINISKTIG